MHTQRGWGKCAAIITYRFGSGENSHKKKTESSTQGKYEEHTGHKALSKLGHLAWPSCLLNVTGAQGALAAIALVVVGCTLLLLLLLLFSVLLFACVSLRHTPSRCTEVPQIRRRLQSAAASICRSCGCPRDFYDRWRVAHANWDLYRQQVRIASELQAECIEGRGVGRGKQAWHMFGSNRL